MTIYYYIIDNGEVTNVTEKNFDLILNSYNLTGVNYRIEASTLNKSRYFYLIHK